MKKFELLAASAIALLYAVPALAQETPAPATTAQDEADATDSDDIIVTATKREQTLQDVPISVAVTSAATIEKAQIRDLIDLQSVVPSLKVAQFNAAGQTNFIIRGFGNGNGNDGIESSVGVFIDGVYRSRSASALDDLPEIERVEVLRGPQSTLFGKNVSAGAISIVTKRPSFDWGGKAEISVGNYSQMQTKATITGPISDSLAFRVSGSLNERDGYFKNLTTGTGVNDRHRWSVRGDILFEPSSDFSIRVIADYNLIKEICCGVTSVFNGPATINGIKNLGFAVSDTTKVFDRNVIFNTDPYNRVLGKGISGQVDWNFGFAKLTSITAYRNQINQSDQDIDFTAADIANNKTSNNAKTFTQEFRLASTGDGPLSWLVGGFYQDEKLDTGRDIRFGKDARAFVNVLSGGLITGLESLQAAVGTPGIVPGSTYFAAGQGIADNYKMKQRSYSLFGQADFKVTDRLTLTGGIAYMNDRKAVVSNVVMNDKFSALNLENVPSLGFVPYGLLPVSLRQVLGAKGYVPGATAPVNLFGASLGASLPNCLAQVPTTGCLTVPTAPNSPAFSNPFALNALQFFYANTANHGPVNYPNANESGIFEGDKVTFAARAAYDLDFVNVYVSYSTGWKASAINLSSDSRPPLNGVGRGAAPEEVTVYEAGAKAKFRGGYLNVAVFKQSIKGFQSNAFTGLGYSLVNAGKESVRGFEVDAAYSPVSALALTGAVTYLDPKYDSFTGAACVNYDTVRCPVNPATGLRPSFRDLSGQRPAGIPTWTFSTSATLSHDLTDDIGAYLRGEYNYTSKFQLTETTPPNLSTYGQNTVNASLGFQSKANQLELMFWVRNLTKDNYLISTFPTVAQDGSYSGYPNQPRTYGATLRKSF
ncbi:MAG: TonB-dependent receptor [Sphingomonas sp.]|jgi:iron complex outermembrane receptor protein|uniref:TonB-dependent receptor n=1 Tax=Sphingomonas sp. TaxID=28214 RepID=UPI00356550A0